MITEASTLAGIQHEPGQLTLATERPKRVLTERVLTRLSFALVYVCKI